MRTNELFDSISLGPLALRNRIVMAPLTRMRAGMPGNVPQPLNAEYYAQRASAGLMITEATPISPTAHGYYGTPGIHTAEQVAGWRQVTGAVHARGAKMFLQLWHVGRVSHPDVLPAGAHPVAPSAISPGTSTITAAGPQTIPVPRALEEEEIPGIVAGYGQAARNAQEAGFDGVEIHAANGYLLEQFLSDSANRRGGRYGGSLENRMRLILEVTDAVSAVWGADRTGIRLSPSSAAHGIEHTDRWGTYSSLMRALAPFALAYVHLVEPRVAGNLDIEPQHDLGSGRFRPLVTGATRIISAGGHTRESARAVVEKGDADLVAFGRHFIANPDLPERLRQNARLNPYHRPTFYGGGVEGYTDYPFLDANGV